MATWLIVTSPPLLPGTCPARYWSLHPLFQADYSQYGFLLNGCWVKFLWSFLTYVDSSLHTESHPNLDLQ